ncbi:carboxypeptidase-like regulatory domain-containing protein [Algibacter pacificus]|uniref:carboxypeptidase-like regulatory domain-containing protein n=1 Tax=Algibacter pacificus TaxID=2599389 RepID=UPI001650B864|nr:carboxypeptidase-like regulatory domain-containing protein [Algibacter pacificus]
MKHFFLITAFLMSAISFAQDNTSIKGNILDLDANNTPLELARISIKETGDKTITDENGNFKFEGLNPGTYTVSVSFSGYETKTIKVSVTANRLSKINETLSPESLSLNDLMLTFANVDAQEKQTNTASNN